MNEAGLEETGSGLAPASDGWFIVHVGDAAWEVSDAFGAACFFESEQTPFAQFGINVRVIWPRRSKWLYHAESTQEDFLVLTGECVLLVEEEEHRLRPWDFAHCSPGTAHAFVGTGGEPCVIVMVGARAADRAIVYPRSDIARRHGVGVETETDSPLDAAAQLGAVPEWHARRPDG